ncbi:MAG: S41 family peptidase, partial [Candidatus Zixiibacteriota bacterium]
MFSRYVRVRAFGYQRLQVAWLSALLVVVACILFLLAVPAAGQVLLPGGVDASPKIDGKIQAQIIDSVAAALDEVYVFPDVALEMGKHLRKQHKDGAYKGIVSTAEFALRLSEDLRSISNDRHLRVFYVPTEDFQHYQQDSLSDEEAKLLEEEHLRQMRHENFGFVRAERLTGNVGYLRLDGFNDARYGGATAVAALNFLAYCDALIIDLRFNGGGHPSMIQLITSYFFEEPQHLNSFYIRKEDTTRQFWTQAQVQGPRMSDADLYVLTSERTFSAAEEFTYNLKNMERATIIGETTGGGAHPVDGRLFANLNVGMSLPFGRAINPITGTNWEGTGIEPHLQVPQDQALEVAHLEALKKLREKATSEDIK